MAKSIVVLSGGQDSTTCLYWALKKYQKVQTITFDYGQRHSIELDAAKKVAQIAELKSFVDRFSANASKAKQATSRANQIKKIKLDDIKNSSRVYPFIRFQQKNKIHNNALEVKDLTKSFGEDCLFNKLNLLIESGERLAIIGPNGIGKSTLLRCLINELEPNNGNIKWSEKAEIGYFAQDIGTEFNSNISLIEKFVANYLLIFQLPHLRLNHIFFLLFEKHSAKTILCLFLYFCLSNKLNEEKNKRFGQLNMYRYKIFLIKVLSYQSQGKIFTELICKSYTNALSFIIIVIIIQILSIIIIQRWVDIDISCRL